MPDAGPKWVPADFDFDRDYKRLGMMESIYTAENPDMRKFKAAGGKLLAYQGWNDNAAVPRNLVDIYETAERTMGGRANTQDFLRLFMIPGMNHCTGGDGPFAIDYLSYLEAWVEHGQAPDLMVGAHLVHDDPIGPDVRKFPLDPAEITFTRPVYPHPISARYKGSGDRNRAENFGPTAP